MILTKEIMINRSIDETVEIKVVQYSDSAKLLIDKSGSRYITAWIEDDVVESDITILEAEYKKALEEIGVL